MISVCPLTKTSRGFRPIDAHGKLIPYPAMHGAAAPVEQSETLADFIERIGALNEYPAGFPDTQALVVWSNQPTNLFCGGQVEYAVGVARKDAWELSWHATDTIYISRQADGSLRLAVPAR